MNNQPRFNNISTRGIMTLTIILSLVSLPLVQYIHHLEKARRLAINCNYQNTYGGEMIIPILILFVGILATLEIDRKRYLKYEKH